MVVAPQRNSYTPNFRTGKTQGTAAAAQVLQQLIGFDPTKVGYMGLEDVQRLSLTAENLEEQVKFAKHAAKKISSILKSCHTIEQIRQEIMKAGLDKYQAINELIGELTKDTNQAQIDERLLQQKIANALQLQGAKAQADSTIEDKSLSNRLLALRQGTATKLQQMHANNRREISESKQRIIEGERLAAARRQYNQTMTQAMNGQIPAGRANSLLANLKKALVSKW
ncbi:hypothetical protein D0962_34535 [Leptolyngbyaceae cyanobacterium CCMR0082]|uniref:Uncharacterized protein n=1 Tax=Adonisia turfae CCMR0082 TaxID=2304604 RepID=A0A6M0SHK3_9CYAN|nr:hypothetical protein [Adonisia turfae]NEZ67816.1 hypothetical protein [Adonisia turfae CCMR0082]